MESSTKRIRESIAVLNACYDWSEVDESALPAALQADRDLDAGRITVEDWERAWMRAGKVAKL